MIFQAGYSEKVWNEDVCAAAEDYAFVLDGASGLNETNRMGPMSDACWLVSSLKNWLILHIHEDRSLEEILRDGLRHLADQYGEYSGLESPSCTITIIRIRNDELEYYVLGDSLLLIETEDRLYSFCDEAVEQVEGLMIARMQELSIEKMKPFLEMRPYVSDLLQKHRLMKNTPEGYWICDLSGVGLSHAMTGSLPLEEVRRCALMSDGMMQLKEFRNLDNEGFLDLLYRRKSRCFPLLMEFQEQDIRCRVLPRLKKRDDTTLVLWTPPVRIRG